jgi:predicted SAM-dependent methyltransferase
MKGINLGAGNQHFESTPEIEWINMDLDDRDGKVEVSGDVSKKLPFKDGEFDVMVASHIVEHIEMSIVSDVIDEWMRCLKPDGILYITVPNARALAERYVTKDIDNYTFAVNMTGPYHNSVADHHRWCYDYDELADRVKKYDYSEITPQDLVGLEGKIALDWWILSLKIKHKK